MALVDSIPSQPLLGCSAIFPPVLYRDEGCISVCLSGFGFICFIFSVAHPGNQKLRMKCLQACCSQILEELVLPVV